MRRISGTSFDADNQSNKFRELVRNEKIGRKEAVSRGLNVYYSKKPCDCGGRVRFTSKSGCVICNNKEAKEKLRAESVDMDKVKARRKIEEIKESNDDYWDSLLED